MRWVSVLRAWGCPLQLGMFRWDLILGGESVGLAGFSASQVLHAATLAPMVVVQFATITLLLVILML